MKYILLFLIFLSSSVFAVNDYDPDAYGNPNRHVFSQIIDHQIYSPAHFFNNNLRYRIDPHINDITIVIGGTIRITVHTAPLVIRAANMWNQHLIAHHSPIRLTEIGSRGEANFWISTANNEQEDALGEDFAQTTLILPDDILNNYFDPPFNIPGVVLANEFHYSKNLFTIIRSIFTNTMTEQEVANMIVYQTISHEFGHALGLLHPTINENEERERTSLYHQNFSIDTQGRHIIGMAMTAQRPRGQPDANVPIMTSDDSYFYLLYEQLHRRLEEGDIGPSELELSAIEMENACSRQ
ncbi:hypothetical protein [Xenorhabdus ishibashii]|uniref:Peptidase M10 metallopeptidase domain-containing protein n=1 Tax=Xenorhabdus ishibashii TaxID=1034471 RepID=A0A2D0KJM7_9GAMM|nr:hypothetical protein [Xenorhabdus ishibashii]PHM63608.1 hypothetical protein Xish_02873 [Xenorhabdus ishibashii]